jgi:hypothetical protein
MVFSARTHVLTNCGSKNLHVGYKVEGGIVSAGVEFAGGSTGPVFLEPAEWTEVVKLAPNAFEFLAKGTEFSTQVGSASLVKCTVFPAREGRPESACMVVSHPMQDKHVYLSEMSIRKMYESEPLVNYYLNELQKGVRDAEKYLLRKREPCPESVDCSFETDAKVDLEYFMLEYHHYRK